MYIYICAHTEIQVQRNTNRGDDFEAILGIRVAFGAASRERARRTSRSKHAFASIYTKYSVSEKGR